MLQLETGLDTYVFKNHAATFLLNWQLSLSPRAIFPPNLDCKLASGAMGMGPEEAGDSTHIGTHQPHKNNNRDKTCLFVFLFSI